DRQFMPERGLLRKDAVRPRQHQLALRGKTLEPVSTLDDLHTQLSLELTDAGRQRGLRDIACLGRATEVALARQSTEVLQLAHQDGTSLSRRKQDQKAAASDRTSHGPRRCRTLTRQSMPRLALNGSLP